MGRVVGTWVALAVVMAVAARVVVVSVAVPSDGGGNDLR